MSPQAPTLPSPEQWLDWRVQVVNELHAGKQSRVFDADLDGERVAVKLTESRLADRAELATRLEAVESLAAEHPDVVPPIRIGGSLIQPIGGWLMTATPFIKGDRLDAGSPSDARQLGRTLSRLHRALSQLAPFEIPPIAALRTTGLDSQRPGWQLLHGDFSDRNAIATPTMLRVFDFDDCGYGPIEYDLANSLYMVLFDSDVTTRPDRYEVFRTAFLAGYVDGSDRPLDEAAIDELMRVRVEALGRWLDDLDSAPIGIRLATPEWLETLGSFVRRARISRR